MPDPEDLIRLAEHIKWEADQMIEMANQLIPRHDWLSTAEFGRLKGISAKTVANYAGEGKYQRIRRNGSGRIEIHISELNR